MTDEIKKKEISLSEMLGWTLAMVLPLTLLGGWVLHLLWSWFIVPLGVPAIGVMHAAGIFLMIRTVWTVGASAEDSKRHPVHSAIIASLTMLTMLGICWLVKTGGGL